MMSNEEQVCFSKAGLMASPVTRNIVDWWDSLAKVERQTIEQISDDIGRKGEELTIKYEEERTKTTPIWESIDSNLMGYDVLSQVSENDSHKILIEVKSSTYILQKASFFITRNEWNIASAEYNKKRYFFYLWLISASPKLAVISYCEMEKHIPIDRGSGEWNEVNVPFATFEEYFHLI